MAFEQNAQHFGGYVMQRPRTGHVSGVPLDQKTCDTWDDIWKFQAHPQDILVAAYPKAGTEERRGKASVFYSSRNQSCIHKSTVSPWKYIEGSSRFSGSLFDNSIVSVALEVTGV